MCLFDEFLNGASFLTVYKFIITNISKDNQHKVTNLDNIWIIDLYKNIYIKIYIT